jgi:hypothetical protein
VKNKEIDLSQQENNEKTNCETPFGQDYFWKELEIIVMDGAQMESDIEE